MSKDITFHHRDYVCYVDDLIGDLNEKITIKRGDLFNLLMNRTNTWPTNNRRNSKKFQTRFDGIRCTACEGNSCTNGFDKHHICYPIKCGMHLIFNNEIQILTWDCGLESTYISESWKWNKKYLLNPCFPKVKKEKKYVDFVLCPKCKSKNYPTIKGGTDGSLNGLWTCEECEIKFMVDRSMSWII